MITYLTSASASPDVMECLRVLRAQRALAEAAAEAAHKHRLEKYEIGSMHDAP